MKPDPTRTLQGVAMTLLTNVMAEVKSPFGQQTIGSAATLAMWIAEEAERAADRLVTENSVTRALLQDGLPLAANARADVEAALATPVAPNFRVSSLQAENDGLRKGLIALHAAVETNAAADAQSINERIWAELVESTRRREFQTRLR